MADDPVLWDFAVSLYRRNGVAIACLALQDRRSVDVPVLLFAAWLGRRAIALAEKDVATIDASIGAWRADVILPLRSVRRTLKSGPPPAPSSVTEALRERVKSAELEAERIELAVLASLPVGVPAQGPTRDTAARNLDTILRHATAEITESDRAALDTILRALD